MEYTFGPWKAVPRFEYVSKDDYGVASDIEGPPQAVMGRFLRSGDAQLVSAAPEMYEALRQIKSVLECPIDDPMEFCRALVKVGEIVDEILLKADTPVLGERIMSQVEHTPGPPESGIDSLEVGREVEAEERR